MRLSSRPIMILLLLLIGLVSVNAETPTPPSIPTPLLTPTHSGQDEGSFDLNEIKIDMAESRLRLRHTTETVADLITALEGYLNASCMPKLIQTLNYPGNPSDPNCIARMTRILELNPGNPVGVCVSAGISAKSCIDAYKEQKIETFYPGSTREGIDPAVRVGLSASDTDKIAKFEEILKDLSRKYEETADEDEKRAFIKDATRLYEQVLTLACKISSVSFEPDEDTPDTSEPAEVTQARERLLQIPVAIRGDYQREMQDKAQKEFTSPGVSKERKEALSLLLKMVEDPSAPPPKKALPMKRSRIILSKCNDLIKQASKAVPDLPHAICYREGWHTPQCINAIKKWRILKQQEEIAVRATPGAKPSPAAVIAHF